MIMGKPPIFSHHLAQVGIIRGCRRFVIGGNMLEVKPIQTKYNGYKFRSRLEARYAVFFDAMGLEYLYEPEGYDLGKYGYYLPDFYLPMFEVFAEVKPQIFTEEEFYKCSILPKPCLILDGEPRVSRAYCHTAVYNEFLGVGGYEYYASGNLYGRILLPESVYKRRLWYLFGETPDDYWHDFEPERKALSARFEYGETP